MVKIISIILFTVFAFPLPITSHTRETIQTKATGSKDHQNNQSEDQTKTQTLEALIAFDWALETDPKNSDALHGKGRTLIRLGKYGEAEEVYNTILEYYPKDFKAWNDKGLALSLMGNHNEALKAIDNSIRIKPDYEDAWFNKATVLGEIGEYAEEIVAFEKARELVSYRK